MFHDLHPSLARSGIPAPMGLTLPLPRESSPHIDSSVMGGHDFHDLRTPLHHSTSSLPSDPFLGSSVGRRTLHPLGEADAFRPLESGLEVGRSSSRSVLGDAGGMNTALYFTMDSTEEEGPQQGLLSTATNAAGRTYQQHLAKQLLHTPHTAEQSRGTANGLWSSITSSAEGLTPSQKFVMTTSTSPTVRPSASQSPAGADHTQLVTDSTELSLQRQRRRDGFIRTAAAEATVRRSGAAVFRDPLASLGEEHLLSHALGRPSRGLLGLMKENTQNTGSLLNAQDDDHGMPSAPPGAMRRLSPARAGGWIAPGCSSSSPAPFNKSVGTKSFPFVKAMKGDGLELKENQQVLHWGVFGLLVAWKSAVFIMPTKDLPPVLLYEVNRDAVTTTAMRSKMEEQDDMDAAPARQSGQMFSSASHSSVTPNRKLGHITAVTSSVQYGTRSRQARTGNHQQKDDSIARAYVAIGHDTGAVLVVAYECDLKADAYEQQHSAGRIREEPSSVSWGLPITLQSFQGSGHNELGVNSFTFHRVGFKMIWPVHHSTSVALTDSHAVFSGCLRHSFHEAVTPCQPLYLRGGQSPCYSVPSPSSAIPPTPQLHSHVSNPPTTQSTLSVSSRHSTVLPSSITTTPGRSATGAVPIHSHRLSPSQPSRGGATEGHHTPATELYPGVASCSSMLRDDEDAGISSLEVVRNSLYIGAMNGALAKMSLVTEDLPLRAPVVAPKAAETSSSEDEVNEAGMESVGESREVSTTVQRSPSAVFAATLDGVRDEWDTKAENADEALDVTPRFLKATLRQKEVPPRDLLDTAENTEEEEEDEQDSSEEPDPSPGMPILRGVSCETEGRHSSGTQDAKMRLWSFSQAPSAQLSCEALRHAALWADHDFQHASRFGHICAVNVSEPIYAIRVSSDEDFIAVGTLHQLLLYSAQQLRPDRSSGRLVEGSHPDLAFLPEHDTASCGGYERDTAQGLSPCLSFGAAEYSQTFLHSPRPVPASSTVRHVEPIDVIVKRSRDPIKAFCWLSVQRSSGAGEQREQKETLGSHTVLAFASGAYHCDLTLYYRSTKQVVATRRMPRPIRFIYADPTMSNAALMVVLEKEAKKMRESTEELFPARSGAETTSSRHSTLEPTTTSTSLQPATAPAMLVTEEMNEYYVRPTFLVATTNTTALHGLSMSQSPAPWSARDRGYEDHYLRSGSRSPLLSQSRSPTFSSASLDGVTELLSFETVDTQEKLPRCVGHALPMSPTATTTITPPPMSVSLVCSDSSSQACEMGQTLIPAAAGNASPMMSSASTRTAPPELQSEKNLTAASRPPKSTTATQRFHHTLRSSAVKFPPPEHRSRNPSSSAFALPSWGEDAPEGVLKSASRAYCSRARRSRSRSLSLSSFPSLSEQLLSVGSAPPAVDGLPSPRSTFAENDGGSSSTFSDAALPYTGRRRGSLFSNASSQLPSRGRSVSHHRRQREVTPPLSASQASPVLRHRPFSSGHSAHPTSTGLSTVAALQRRKHQQHVQQQQIQQWNRVAEQINQQPLSSLLFRVHVGARNVESLAASPASARSAMTSPLGFQPVFTVEAESNVRPETLGELLVAAMAPRSTPEQLFATVDSGRLLRFWSPWHTQYAT